MYNINVSEICRPVSHVCKSWVSVSPRALKGFNLNLVGGPSCQDMVSAALAVSRGLFVYLKTRGTVRWPGLAWPGLGWPGLAWTGLGWPGLAWGLAPIVSFG